MTRNKSLLYNYLSPIVKFFPLNSLINLTRSKIVLPYYHAISDAPSAHFRYLYHTLTINEFEQSLEFLTKKFQMVSLEKLLSITQRREMPKKPVCHITFDNGLSEFYEIVAPILYKKGIPATCFLQKDFIDNKDIFYGFKASLLIDKLRSQKAGSEDWCLFHQWELAHDLNEKYYRKVLLSIRNDKQALLDELAHVIHLNFSDYIQKKHPYMTDEQIKSLLGQGFTFGIEFQDYNAINMTSEEFTNLTIQNIQDISSRFNLSNKVLSFNSRNHNITQELFKFLEKNKSCDLFFGNVMLPQVNNSNYLKRFSAEIPKHTMNKVIKTEYIYQILYK